MMDVDLTDSGPGLLNAEVNHTMKIDDVDYCTLRMVFENHSGAGGCIVNLQHLTEADLVIIEAAISKYRKVNRV